MKVLHLTLKKRWFDMIASGEKKEEYRELKPYWAKRFAVGVQPYFTHLLPKGYGMEVKWKEYNAVKFARGGHFHSSIPQMTVELVGIEIARGKKKWGAEPGKKYFVIKLGNIISKPSIT